MNLTDLLVRQNNGAAINALSQRFNLSPDQTIQAVEALMPAFSHGLKRNVSSSTGAASFIEALASGRHAQYASDPRYAGAQSGLDDGNAILGHIFGNKDVSRGVAGHAAQSTGIGASILKQMLPMIASMIMGSLFKGSSSKSGGGLGGMLGQAAGGGILGQIIEGLAGGALQGGRGNRTRSRQTSPSLEDLLGGLLGGGGSQKRPQRRRNPSTRTAQPQSRRRSTNGGLGDILEQLAGGSRQQRRANPYAPERRPHRSQPRQRGGLEGIFGDMLESGGRQDEQYRRDTGSVFDQFLGE